MNFTYESNRLILKILFEDSACDVLEFLHTNKSFFEPYEACKPENYYSVEYQRENLKAELNGFRKHKYIRFYVFLKEYPDKIIGTVSFSNILQYPYSSATIGYKISKDYQHMGIARETVTCAICSVFRDMNLHRVDAYVMPQNTSSINLLEHVGFVNEGLCHEIIKINDIYEDHFRYAVINNFTQY